MRLLLLLLLALGDAFCSCPTGFELVNGQECRGNYTRITISAREALNKCSEILGNTIIIKNDEDQQYWAGRVKNATYTVLGFSCNTTSKRFEWVDGTPLDYKPNGNYYFGLDQECTQNSVGLIWNSDEFDGFWDYDYPDTVYTRDIFCSMPLRQPLPPADACDTFEDDIDDGVCYQVAAAAENWEEAQTICGGFGASVASVHNTQENSFIRRLAVSKGATGGLFLGAAPSGKGNEFGWLDGSDWDYDNFYPGFPMKGVGQCLMMDTSLATGNWANIDCSRKLPVVCKREKNYNLPSCSDGNWIEGQIMFSPGFPYDASVPCNFVLSVDPGRKVELEVLLLEANPVYDYLVIYENYFGTNIIANLTGIINDTKYTTSSSNFMRVSWQPNGGENVRGVMFTYHRAV